MDNNNEIRQCPRDCKQCSFAQRSFCSAQIALYILNMVKALVDRVEAFEGKVNNVLEQATVVSPIAQEGEAVQTIDSPVTNQKKRNNEQ